MILAASLTFIVLGFAPILKAKKGLTYSTILLLIVSIPLALSFYSLVLQSNDYKKLSTLKTLVINQKDVQINILKINQSKTHSANIDIEVISKERLSTKEYEEIQTHLNPYFTKKLN